MPVLVREMTDEQAVIAMVDSNVQRENVLPSEKAFAYKMKMEALSRQGKRDDLTSAPMAWKSRGRETAAIIGEAAGESKDQVRRYIRLTELIPQLLELVDVGKIAFRPAVELSFLSVDQQTLLLSVMEAEQATPSLSQALKLKSFSVSEAFGESTITALMREQKGNQHEHIRISYEKVRSILKKDMPPKELESVILRAVSDYQRKLQRQLEREAR